MKLFSAIEKSASGLTAQRFRLDLIASNLANSESTRTEDGGVYRRKVAVFASRVSVLLSEMFCLPRFQPLLQG